MLDIIVFGSEGQLGYDCVNTLSKKYNVYPITSLLDINNHKAVFKKINQICPEYIINCAALTNLNLLTPKKYYQTNSDAVKNLAIICDKLGSKLIHISSNYVFDGQKTFLIGYDILDSPNPINEYGKSKLLGEKYIQEILPENQYAIIRVSWVYGIGGKSNNSANYVKTLINNLLTAKTPILASKNRYDSPTDAFEISKYIEYIIKHRIFGLLHCSSTNYCTRFEFCKTLFSYLNIPEDLLSEDLKIDIESPINNILTNNLLQYDMPTWQDSINEFMKKYSNPLFLDIRGR